MARSAGGFRDVSASDRRAAIQMAAVRRPRREEYELLRHQAQLEIARAVSQHYGGLNEECSEALHDCQRVVCLAI